MSARHAEEPRTVVTCRILPPLIARLDALAELDNRSRSEMIERAIGEFVERHERQRPTKSKGK